MYAPSNCQSRLPSPTSCVFCYGETQVTPPSAWSYIQILAECSAIVESWFTRVCWRCPACCFRYVKNELQLPLLGLTMIAWDSGPKKQVNKTGLWFPVLLTLIKFSLTFVSKDHGQSGCRCPFDVFLYNLSSINAISILSYQASLLKNSLSLSLQSTNSLSSTFHGRRKSA